MLKQMKQAPDEAPTSDLKDLSKTVLDSSRQIWLAGPARFQRRSPAASRSSKAW